MEACLFQTLTKTRDLVKMSSARIQYNTTIGTRNMWFCKCVPDSSSRPVGEKSFPPHYSWAFWHELYQARVPLHGDESVTQLERNVLAIFGRQPLHYSHAKRLSSQCLYACRDEELNPAKWLVYSQTACGYLGLLWAN